MLINILQGILVVMVGVLSLLCLIATIRLLKAAIAAPVAAHPGKFIPIVDPNPPAPIQPTATLSATAWLILIWALLHVAICIVFAAYGFWPRMLVASIVMTAYVLVAAMSDLIGGVMLLKRIAYGRRMVAWGLMLMAIMSFMVFAMAVIMQYDENIAQQVRSQMAVLAAILVGHIVVDTLLGTIAQHAGVPEGYKPPEHDITEDLAALEASYHASPLDRN